MKPYQFFTLLAGLTLITSLSFADESPELSMKSSTGITVESIRLSAQADIKITGLNAKVTLTQSYKNSSKFWVEGLYTLPLPEDAAITSLQIKTKNGVIEAVVKEKKQAKIIYSKAKEMGQQASLLESERPNLFTSKVANIAPESTVEITVSYLQSVSFKQDLFSLRLPNTLTPRYIPRTYSPSESQEEASVTVTNTGWANIQGISPPQKRSDTSTQQIAINAEINAGVPLDFIRSPSHEIDWKKDNDHYTVALKNTTTAMDKDYVLTWQASPSNTPSAAVFSENNKGENYLNLMVMPPQKIQATLPREVVFVIDSSGSMKGSSMRQAKRSLEQALTYLSPKDMFNIIDFDDSTDILFNQSVNVTQSSLQKALYFIKNMVADGGTEIKPALLLALKQPAKEGFLKQVIFLTDGSVGNEKEIFKSIKQNLNETRLFTIGIGSAPNSYFMRKAAQFGRGSFTYVDDIKNVNQQMSRLFQQISSPVLRDIYIEWPEGVKAEVFANPLPDLYLGEPLLVYAKLDQAKKQTITIHGKLLNKKWSRQVTFEKGMTATGLSKIWARKKIEHLMDLSITGTSEKTIEKQVLAVALKHQIVSKYTSLIAVDKIISRPEGSPFYSQKIANLMPQGNTMTILYPQTATTAELRAYMGLLFLLLALAFLYKEQQRKRRELV